MAGVVSDLILAYEGLDKSPNPELTMTIWAAEPNSLPRMPGPCSPPGQPPTPLAAVQPT